MNLKAILDVFWIRLLLGYWVFLQIGVALVFLLILIAIAA